MTRYLGHLFCHLRYSFSYLPCVNALSPFRIPQIYTHLSSHARGLLISSNITSVTIQKTYLEKTLLMKLLRLLQQKPVQPSTFHDNLKPYILHADDGGHLGVGYVLTHASPQQGLNGIFTHMESQLRQWETEGKTGQVLLYVHGGLRKEAFSLEFARKQLDYCLSRNIYPIFLTWHTGTTETLGTLGKELLKKKLNVASLLKNPMAVPHWGWQRMKQNAQALSAENSGALYQFLTKLNKLKDGFSQEVPLHFVGHSAGSIVIGHALPYWCGTLNNPLHHVSLLGAAIRCEAFEELYGPALASKQLQHLQLVNLSAASELKEMVWHGFTHPSLLYGVSYLFDPETPPGLTHFMQPQKLAQNASALLGMHHHIAEPYGEQLEQLREKWQLAPHQLEILWVDRQDDLFQQAEPVTALESNHAVLDRQLFGYVVEKTLP